MSQKKALSLFEGIGIELEYMIVKKGTLDVSPISDELLKSVIGSYESDYENGKIAWSNELVMHIIELKTNGPRKSIKGLAKDFNNNISQINKILDGMGCMLMPTSAHPWMDPIKETKLWSHEYNEVYEMYDRIFGCKGHGWSNIQSTHINLPFNGDEEFRKLHSAIRLILPLLPALSASSPIFDGKPTGMLDSRLNAYRNNQRRVPAIAGKIIPEPVVSKKEYQKKILDNIYKDISPHDPKGILQHEWLNSRGAIARFERDALEIRLLDIQECPLVDVSVASFIIAILRSLVDEKTVSIEDQEKVSVDYLAGLFDGCIIKGMDALIDNKDYLSCFGLKKNPVNARELLKHLRDICSSNIENKEEALPVLNNIILYGNLSERIIRSLGNDLSKENMKRTYGRLSACLSEGKMFL